MSFKKKQTDNYYFLINVFLWHKLDHISYKIGNNFKQIIFVHCVQAAYLNFSASFLIYRSIKMNIVRRDHALNKLRQVKILYFWSLNPISLKELPCTNVVTDFKIKPFTKTLRNGQFYEGSW